MRDGELERITEDHSLVEELLRQGRLTEEEAEEHPQRSIITRALGPEPDVEVDTFAVDAQDGDVYLLCSDGLTSMVAEQAIAEILAERNPSLAAAADALVAAALAAGGRDNVTVVLFRIEDGRASPRPPRDAPSPAVDRRAGLARSSAPTAPAPLAARAAIRRAPGRAVTRSRRRAPAPRAAHAAPRAARAAPAPAPASRSPRWSSPSLAVLAIAAAARRAVGLLHRHRRQRPGHGVQRLAVHAAAAAIRLYTPYFVSGVTVAELSPLERSPPLQQRAALAGRRRRALVSQLELGRIAGQ